MKTQTDLILECLKKGDRITQKSAYWAFNCTRLAARIYDLRAAGYKVVSETVTKKSPHTGQITRYAEYWLEVV